MNQLAYLEIIQLGRGYIDQIDSPSAPIQTAIIVDENP